MNPEDLRAIATRMAHSLGVSLYINDGRIHQIGPGERIDPPKTAHSSESHGRFSIAAASKPSS
jgi:hypothetical protein